MPHRLNPERAKIQFITSAEMPFLIYQACGIRGIVSNTRYIQEAVCQRLSKDLGIPLPTLLDALPANKGMAKALFGKDRRPVNRGREHTNEQVR